MFAQNTCCGSYPEPRRQRWRVRCCDKSTPSTLSIGVQKGVLPHFACCWGLYLNGEWERHRHRQLVGLWSRWCAMRAAHSWLRRSGDAGDVGPNSKGLDPGGSILGGGHLMAAEVEEVVDPVMGGEEALCLAG